MWRRFAVAVAASALTLAAATAQAEPKQGGEMVVTYKDDISTFDPAIGYDWQNWSMIKSLFDGLMDYKPGTTELIPDLAESYTDLGGRAGLHLQAARRRQVPQWPRAAGLGHQVLDRARGESRDAEPRPGFLLAHQRLRRNGLGRGEGALGHHHARRLHRQDRAVAAGCDVPAHRRHQFRLRGAARGGREARPGLRSQSGGHRRLQDDRVDARPARRVRAQRRLLPRGRALPRQDHLRGRPGAAGGAPATEARRGRRAGRPDSVGQLPAGEGRPGECGPDHQGRSPAHRLHHHEHHEGAVRQQAGAPGGEHGDQQGAGGAHRQWPRCGGQPAVAAGDARIRRRTTRAILTTPRKPRTCSPRPVIRTASRPSSTP